MTLASMWKKIRQRIRAKNKLILALQLLTSIAILIILNGYMMVVTVHAAENMTQAHVDDISSWLQKDEHIEAILHRKYVCGDEIEHLGVLSYEDIVILAEQHMNWELTVDQAYTLVSFVEEINDLSPYCKKNAFFGLNDTGTFTLFDGKPADEKVIKTFFQLNMPYMESNLPDHEIEHLMIGIRVHDIEEYDSVLSTFSEFSIDRFVQDEQEIKDISRQ